MRKRIAVFLMALVILVSAHSSAVQQPAGKVPRLGFLLAGSPSSTADRVEGFRQGLRELGWVEGRNISVEYRWAAGRMDRLPALAGELVRMKVDVIVAAGALAIRAAKKVTSTIPVVMGNAGDPVGTGLVASLARPGGNVTGVSELSAGVVTKRLELLKEVVPAASRVAVLLNPANPTNSMELKEIQAVSPAFGVILLPLEVKGPDDIERAFATMKKELAGALIILGDQTNSTRRNRIIELAIKDRLPAIFGRGVAVHSGGLMSYGASFGDLYRRAATYVDKILKGAKPADLPVEQPTKFELVINLKTAKALGITVPPEVLQRADRVIK